MSVLLVGLVNYAYYIVFGLIIAWVLIGWFPTYPSNRVLRVLYDLVGNLVTPMMWPNLKGNTALEVWRALIGPLSDRRPLCALLGAEPLACGHREPRSTCGGMTSCTTRKKGDLIPR